MVVFLFIHKILCNDINYLLNDPLYLKTISEIIEPSVDLKINEILTNNLSVNTDESGEYDDWIELYNFGDDTINLNSLYISDSRSNLSKFQILTDTFIIPKGYILIWTDGEPNQGALHTSFKLDGKGENIFICDDNLNILDSISFGEQSTNVSYGRLKDDFLTWNYFSEPTPGTVNADVGLLKKIDPPAVNLNSGYYYSPVCFEINHNDNEVEIHYTINGDIPAMNSPLYDSCIAINKTTIVRYKCFKEGRLPSSTETRTFFFEDKKDLDVMSISINSYDLYGASGIFSTKTRDVEKPVHIEYFGNDNKLKFKLDGGMQIHSPKSNPQLSFRLYARSDYGYDNIDYQIFPNKEIYSFKRIVLRNSGNDGTASKSENMTHFRDALHHMLFEQMNDSEYSSAYKPVNVYFNGQYFGIYNLRERIDKYFIESNMGYTGEMDLLERAFKYTGNRNAIEGNFELYDSLYRFMNNNDISLDENYQIVANILDIDQFIDYWILEVYIGNFDWLVNNIKIFRPYFGDSKFQWILWDTDHGSGLPFLQYGNPEWTTLNWSLSIDQLRTEGGVSTVFQRNIVKNETFKKKFVSRYADLLNTVFSYSNIEKNIDSIKTMLQNDMKLHDARWECSYSSWLDAIAVVKQYHQSRADYVRQDIKNCFSLSEQYQITLQTNDGDQGIIKINTIIPDYENNEWQGTYFSDIPVTIEAIPGKGYLFKGWENTVFNENTIQTINLISDTIIKAIFEPVSINTSKMIINEISYVNPYNDEKGDWVEIMNMTGIDMYMKNWKLCIANDTFIFENPVIKNYDFLIVTSEQNNLKNKTNVPVIEFDDFELNNFGTNIKLLNSENNIIDELDFKSSPPWPVLSSQNEFTLDLSDADADNTLAQNWKASIYLGGSPGIENPAVESSMKNLVINEFMANNDNCIPDEYGEYDDWIELYNKGNKPIDIRGLFITDNFNNPLKYQIPYNMEPVTIDPGDFLLLWADNDDSQGPLHLNFKLDNSGEEIAIYQNDGYDIIEIDRIKFKDQSKLFSYGRIYDGVGSRDEDWIFLNPTPGTNNSYLSVSESKIINSENVQDYLIYPIPARNEIFIKNLNTNTTTFNDVKLYNLLGKLEPVEQNIIDNATIRINISYLKKGIYIVKIANKEGSFYTYKIIKSN